MVVERGLKYLYSVGVFSTLRKPKGYSHFYVHPIPSFSFGFPLPTQTDQVFYGGE